MRLYRRVFFIELASTLYLLMHASAEAQPDDISEIWSLYQQDITDLSEDHQHELLHTSLLERTKRDGKTGKVQAVAEPPQSPETEFPAKPGAARFGWVVHAFRSKAAQNRTTGITKNTILSGSGAVENRANSGDRTIPALCGPSTFTPEEIQQLVEQAALKHDVDVRFALAIAFVESGFNRHRNSPKGARGVMQLMPDTAARFSVSDVCDAGANVTAGIRYLRILQDEFQNPLIVAAAYNAGEARVYEYGGIPPFAETVSYVARVVNYQLGLAPPSRGGQKRLPAASRPDSQPLSLGVIGVRKDGKFNGGVMHF